MTTTDMPDTQHGAPYTPPPRIGWPRLVAGHVVGPVFGGVVFLVLSIGLAAVLALFDLDRPFLHQTIGRKSAVDNGARVLAFLALFASFAGVAGIILHAGLRFFRVWSRRAFLWAGAAGATPLLGLWCFERWSFDDKAHLYWEETGKLGWHFLAWEVAMWTPSFILSAMAVAWAVWRIVYGGQVRQL